MKSSEGSRNFGHRFIFESTYHPKKVLAKFDTFTKQTTFPFATLLILGGQQNSPPVIRKPFKQ